MAEREYVARFRQSESRDPGEAKKRVINFVRALARADARQDAAAGANGDRGSPEGRRNLKVS